MKTVLIVVLLVSTFAALAQPNRSTIPEASSTKMYTLLLKDGSIVSGRIVRRDSTNLVVRQRNGRLTYVDLELFDRIIADPSDRPAPAANAVNTAPLIATDGPDNYLIVFKDGSQVLGRVVSWDSTTLVIRKRNGQLTYADPALVETIQNPSPPGPENPFAPFMTLNPTAYSVDAGRLYYRNVLLFYNEFTYGITPYWSIGTSLVPVMWFFEGNGPGAITFQSKVSFPIGSVVRIGGNVVYQPSRNYELLKPNATWDLQAMASLGDSQRNITIGYGRSSTNIKEARQPYFTVSALLKLSSGVSFITDNTLYTNQNRFYTGTGSLFSAAVRFDRPRHTFDLGVMGQTYVPSYFDRYFGFSNQKPQFYPYLAYTVRFGR